MVEKKEIKTLNLKEIAIKIYSNLETFYFENIEKTSTKSFEDEFKKLFKNLYLINDKFEKESKNLDFEIKNFLFTFINLGKNYLNGLFNSKKETEFKNLISVQVKTYCLDKFKNIKTINLKKAA